MLKRSKHFLSFLAKENGRSTYIWNSQYLKRRNRRYTLHRINVSIVCNSILVISVSARALAEDGWSVSNLVSRLHMTKAYEERSYDAPLHKLIPHFYYVSRTSAWLGKTHLAAGDGRVLWHGFPQGMVCNTPVSLKIGTWQIYQTIQQKLTA